jgi:hypothetical protein
MDRPDRPEPEKRERVDVYHHFPEGLPTVKLTIEGLDLKDLALALSGALTVTVLPPPPPPATHAVIVITTTQGDTNMAGQITVDTTNETATLAYLDDKGDTDAAAPAGAVATFTSSDPAVATIAANPANPNVGDITPVAEGSTDIGVTLANADGSPVLEADGSTPFPTPAAVTVTVGAGAAVGDSLTLSV